MSAPQYRYPESYDERVAWHTSGTPAPFTPYTRETPDATRDGLLAGFLAHQGAKA